MDDDRVAYTRTWTVDWTTVLCGHMERYRWRLQSGSSQLLRTTESLIYIGVKKNLRFKNKLMYFQIYNFYYIAVKWCAGCLTTQNKI